MPVAGEKEVKSGAILHSPFLAFGSLTDGSIFSGGIVLLPDV
jgi:hypothetical protein